MLVCMEQIIMIVNTTARFVAILGGALTAVFVIYSGILWITSAGDPQKIMQARNALLGCVVGVIIVGMGFLIPGVISRWVIEPAGGLSVDSAVGADCDRMLREQLVYQRNAKTSHAMQQLIYHVQLRNREHCSQDLWSPKMELLSTTPPGCVVSTTEDGPVDSGGNPTTIDVYHVGPVRLPQKVVDSTDWRNTKRFLDGHILVVFERDVPGEDKQPADGAICWFYHSVFDAWASGYLKIS